MASEQAKDQKTNEKILAEFQRLRNDQRNLINNLNTLEMDLKEHKTVIETLKQVDPDRKCFRLIGGVLCERTVKDVLPQLVENKTFFEKTIVGLNEELKNKGIEINKFKDEHNIRLRGEQIKTEEPPKENAEKPAENRNVLSY